MCSEGQNDMYMYINKRMYACKHTYMQNDSPIYVNACACIHCNTRQHTATQGNTLCVEHFFFFQSLAVTHCKKMQHIATHCNTLQHTATHCFTLFANFFFFFQSLATAHNTLPHTATHYVLSSPFSCRVHYNTLQRPATHYNTLDANLHFFFQSLV